jgi:hypothetical protein
VLKSTSKTETADTPYPKKPPKLKSQARPKSETSFATQSVDDPTRAMRARQGLLWPGTDLAPYCGFANAMSKMGNRSVIEQ